MKKTILITGTSTGFGKLMTITLAQAGHTVIAQYISNRAGYYQR
jgi:NADP-dependent 3-hydroxy acid dehydrogenase YdfG